jgi:hypothetical protein
VTPGAVALSALVTRTVPFHRDDREMTVFVLEGCAKCGGPRAQGEPWGYANWTGLKYANFEVRNRCGHYERYVDLVVESRDNVRAIVRADPDPFITAMSREYLHMASEWLRTQPEDAE